jgi:arsenite methyltransferase
MSNRKSMKEIVKEKYGKIAADSEVGCGCSCCGKDEKLDYAIVGDDYNKLDGYFPEADLGLGCGLPTEHADLSEGDTVVDLGSGAGNDVFVARRIVGASGYVIGIDMTEEMIKKARKNNQKLGYENVEFRLGEIEDLPLDDESADVVVSNCVLNLVPDKEKAFAEIFRVLKYGGHFCISDIVLHGNLPEVLTKSAEMYAGCVAGALQQEQYLEIMKKTGFTKVQIRVSRKIQIPEVVLEMYLKKDEIAVFKKANVGIFSITVVGYK